MKDPIDNNQVSMIAFKRLLFMALFFALFGIVRFILWAIVLFQFIAHLLTGRATRLGVKWGEALSAWIYNMLLFMSYSTDRMPFPFSAFGARED